MKLKYIRSIVIIFIIVIFSFIINGIYTQEKEKQEILLEFEKMEIYQQGFLDGMGATLNYLHKSGQIDSVHIDIGILLETQKSLQDKRFKTDKKEEKKKEKKMI